MSRAGSALDNATSESFHSTIKVEYIYRQQFTTRAEANRQYLRLAGRLLQPAAAASRQQRHVTHRPRTIHGGGTKALHHMIKMSTVSGDCHS